MRAPRSDGRFPPVIASAAVEEEPDRSRRRRSSRAALALALASSLMLAAGAASAQTDQEKAAARELATQGAKALDAHQYAQALDLVTRAQALVNAPTHLLMIARSQVGLGRFVAAQETYLKLIRMDLAPSAPAAFKNAQSVAKDELAAVEPKIAQLRIMLDGIGARSPTVQMDGAPVPGALLGVYQPVDPGRHEVTVAVTGIAPLKGTVDLVAADKKDIHIAVPEGGPPGTGAAVVPVDNGGGTPPTPPPADTGGGGFFTPLRWAGLAAGVVGLGGVVVGAAFFAKSGSTTSAANTLCGGPPPAVCPKSVMSQVMSDESSAASQKTIGAAGLGVGGALVATGVVLIILGKPKSAAPAAATRTLEPWFSRDAAGLRGTF